MPNPSKAEIVEETMRLFDLRYDGDDPARVAAWREARGRIVELNKPMILDYIRQRPNSTRSTEDRIQDGLIALDHAATKFDPACGTQFSTYAHWWIRNYAQRYFRAEAFTIWVPTYIQKLIAIGKKDPDACVYGRHEARVADAQKTMNWADPIQPGPAPGTTSDMLIEWAVDRDESPLDGMVARDQIENVRDSIERVLTPRERDVVRRRFGMGCEAESLQQIGDTLGLSKERIRQIESIALGRLRKAIATASPAETVGAAS